MSNENDGVVTFQNQVAQGESWFKRISEIPETAVEVAADKNGLLIVAHSETGHHHAISYQPGVSFFRSKNDPMTAYLKVGKTEKPVVLRHLRGFDTHRPVQFSEGVYQVRYGRESTPSGWRRSMD